MSVEFYQEQHAQDLEDSWQAHACQGGEHPCQQCHDEAAAAVARHLLRLGDYLDPYGLISGDALLGAPEEDAAEMAIMGDHKDAAVIMTATSVITGEPPTQRDYNVAGADVTDVLDEIDARLAYARQRVLQEFAEEFGDDLWQALDARRGGRP